MDVDEARRDVETGRVDLGHVGRRHLADRGDAAVLDRDVGRERLAARAVEDRAVADHEIDHARLPP